MWRGLQEDELKDVEPTPINVNIVGPRSTVGYATAPHDAIDATIQTGRYVKALRKHMHKIDTDINYMLREVGDEVFEMSGGKQQPVSIWDSWRPMYE